MTISGLDIKDFWYLPEKWTNGSYSMKIYLPKDMNVLKIPEILLSCPGQVGQKVYLPTSKFYLPSWASLNVKPWIYYTANMCFNYEIKLHGGQDD